MIPHSQASTGLKAKRLSRDVEKRDSFNEDKYDFCYLFLFHSKSFLVLLYFCFIIFLVLFNSAPKYRL